MANLAGRRIHQEAQPPTGRLEIGNGFRPRAGFKSAPGDEHELVSGGKGGEMGADEFTHAAFASVSNNGIANLATGNHSGAQRAPRSVESPDDETARNVLSATLKDPLEFSGFSEHWPGAITSATFPHGTRLFLVANRQALAALATTVRQYFTPRGGRHTGTEPVGTCALDARRLIGAFHVNSILTMLFWVLQMKRGDLRIFPPRLSIALNKKERAGKISGFYSAGNLRSSYRLRMGAIMLPTSPYVQSYHHRSGAFGIGGRLAGRGTRTGG